MRPSSALFLPCTVAIASAALLPSNSLLTIETTRSLFSLNSVDRAASRTRSLTISAPPEPSSAQPCNGHTEFCQRRFSNISMVVAHNSPFVRPHNAASNQLCPVIDQLNDGVRGCKLASGTLFNPTQTHQITVQFQTHKPDAASEIKLCHTTCDFLDVGKLETYLITVRKWLDTHPQEIVTLLMGNNNGQSTRIPAAEYVAPFEASGMKKYVWSPVTATMNITEWPTLDEMIATNQRVVVMLDYGSNQTEVPWLLSEFNYQWETPLSPTDPAFPCTQERPVNQSLDFSRSRMYMMNHNLNIHIPLKGFRGEILIPAYSVLGDVNAVSGGGSLGLNVKNCERMWGRPPNWLLIDYYNIGNGSVFEVAAAANNVTYKPKPCCGSRGKNTASGMPRSSGSLLLGWILVLLLV